VSSAPQPRLDRYSSPVTVVPEVEPLIDYLAPGGNGSTAARVDRARAANHALGHVIGALVGSVFHPTILEANGPANVVPERATAELQCIVLPGTTKDELERELRAALGDGDYRLDVTDPNGGLTSELDTPLHAAIQGFLQENDPAATLVPALGYGFSDCHVFREAYGTVAYGFIPFRHADPMTNLTTKHSVDERVLLADLEFQVQAALHIARAVGGANGC
jgi:acetylornithine deacetylase/succinyl-diaminopimelate desuccinylase-like protein